MAEAKYCTHCPGNGEMCDDCLGDYIAAREAEKDHDDHFDRRRNYSRTVSAVMLGVLVVVFAVATVCGVVNVLWPKH